MRRIVIACMSTISGLVLLFSYHTSTGQSGAGALGGGLANANGSKAGGSGSSGSSNANGSAGSSSGATSGPTSGAKSGASGAATTVTGNSVDTRWGPVQVRITVQNGKITASEAVVYPNGNGRDQMINSYALPILNQEAVQANSAQIDAVSGATVTSGGYQQSLQSAVDQAHLS
jgi:uncharacterized protein with FMN-binding domain